MDGIAKPVVWMGDSLARVRAFAKPAREDIGFQLERVQRGLEPRDWKPMPSVGRSVVEVRVHAEGEYRVFYMARFRDAVYVLHAFIKKSAKTSSSDIALGRQRYRELARELK